MYSVEHISTSLNSNLSVESVHPSYKVQARKFFFLFGLIYLFPLQSLSIHLTSTKGPIEVLLCPDEENDPRSPVKNGNMDINGNSPFLKVLQGLFHIDSCHQLTTGLSLLSFNFLCGYKETTYSWLAFICNLGMFLFILTQDSW